MESGRETVLVVSAHAADFVWRAGGAIALYASRGHRVRVVCLSYGERGESQGLWKKPGMTVDQAKKARHEEASQAAAVLGAEIDFFDAGDYPLGVTPEVVDRLVGEFRKLQPTIVLAHAPNDPYNGDHPEASRLTLNARVYAQALGYPSPEKPLGAPPVFCFEPHQTEMCEFKLDVLLDITSVFELKRKAMECMRAQEHLWSYYTDVASRRGTQAVRNSGKKGIKYAEAYQRIYPQVADVLA
ncbi:MAG TPA: PIG-L deacetylase family protein [Blastocatellia bacterium]|nr:PIG-L deacetylase family protein [Blastocatellia bacterium]